MSDQQEKIEALRQQFEFPADARIPENVLGYIKKIETALIDLAQIRDNLNTFIERILNNENI